MHVEIDDGHALHAIGLAGIERRNGDVGENAKAHGPLALGMVAARPHLTKDVADARGLIHDAVDPGQPGPHRAQRRLPRLGRKHRIRIEPHRSLTLAGTHALHPIKVGERMRERDRRLDVLAQRRLLAPEAVEGFVRQRLVDGAHPIGPLGMARPRVMLNKARVGDQEGGHRGARNRPEIVDRGSRLGKASPAGGISQRTGSSSWGAAAVFFAPSGAWVVLQPGQDVAGITVRRETPGRTPW